MSDPPQRSDERDTVDMSPEEIKASIDYLKEWEDGRNWAELKFTEAHLGNINTLRSYVTSALDYPESPIYIRGGISEEALNQIGQAVRKVVRLESGLPPIGDEELSSWSFEPKPPKRFEGPSQKVTSTIPIPESRYAEIFSYLSEKCPEALNFRRDVLLYLEAEEGEKLPIEGSYFGQRFLEALYHLFPVGHGQMWEPIDVINLREYVDARLSEKSSGGQHDHQGIHRCWYSSGPD